MLLFFGEEYSQASYLLGYLAVSIVLMNTYFFSPGLNIAKKTKLIAGISILVAFINLVGNYFLIPILSMEGAAISSLISSFIMVVLYFYLGYREYKIEVNFLEISSYFFITCVLVSFVKLLFADFFIYKITIFFLLLLLFLFFNRLNLKLIKEIFVERDQN